MLAQTKWLYAFSFVRTDCFLRRQAQGRHVLHLPKSQVDGDGHHQSVQVTSITNENYSLWTTSYLCSWCSSYSRLWAERSKAFSTETSEMISEETDKELPYLPSIMGKPYCKHQLQYGSPFIYIAQKSNSFNKDLYVLRNLLMAIFLILPIHLKRTQKTMLD